MTMRSTPPNRPLAAGTLVRVKTDLSRGGLLLDGPPLVLAGKVWRRVKTMNGTVEKFPEELLEPVPGEIETPLELLKQGRFTGPSWLRRALMRIRVTGRLSDVVYSMEATDTDFHAHQFKPVLKMLNSPTDGLLIADEVGLGKTIEAGLIWTELRARYDLSRLLVVCPKTLCGKWRTELAQRFGVDARIMDAQELCDLLSDPVRTRQGFAAIGWMQGLRPPSDWQDDADEGRFPSSPRARLARILRDSASEDPVFDLLVIDEAHHMRNPETGLYKLAELLQPVSSHRIFLSATPIHLKNRDLFSLLRLLDPETFSHESAFVEILQANRPLIAARDEVLRLGSGRDEIAGLLDEAAVHPLLEGNQQLTIVHQELLRGNLDPTHRSSIAWRLEQANLLAHVVTRTRRRDVEDLRVQRDIMDPVLEMDPVEAKFYEAVTAEVSEYALGRTANERFLLSTPQRMLTSSPAAAASYWSSRGPIFAADEDDYDDDDFTTADRPVVDRLCDLVRRLGLTQRLEEVDTKYRHLSDVIRALKRQDPSAKIIVFSSFIPTLEYLERRLHEDGVTSLLLHGSIEEDRDVVLVRFRTDPAADVLLSSEVGSEGIDLQFCWAIVNYDIPWNPMRLEQRIGRVDRFGQRKAKVIVHNLVYAGTIDDRIYQRLYRRLDLCRHALGEFEAILGEPIRELTRVLMDPELTAEEQERRIEQTAQALENRRAEQERLESEAAGLVAHGDYILQTIRAAHDLHRWIKAEDVLLYVRDGLARTFPGSEINPLLPSTDLFEIKLTEQAWTEFADFCAERGMRGLTRLLGSTGSVRYRFTSSVVRSREPNVENISQVHPLVRFVAHLDAREDAATQGAALAVMLDAEHAPPSLGRDTYALACMKWSAGPSTGGDKLAFEACRVADDKMLDSKDAEELATAVAISGKPKPNAGADPFLKRAGEVLESSVIPVLRDGFERYLAEYTAEAEDRAAIQLRTLERHVELQTKRLHEIAEAHRMRGSRSLVAATEGRLRKLIERTSRRRAQIETRRRTSPSFVDICTALVEIV